MKAFFIVATKGRAKETFILLDYLSRQTYPIEKILIVGSEQKDIDGLESHSFAKSKKALIILSNKASLTIQRNVGLNLLYEITSALHPRDWFVTFFDDDFRPANNWLENCRNHFITNPNLVGLTGHVLADGVHGSGLSEFEVEAVLKNPYPNLNVVTQGIGGLYGCNMSYRGTFAGVERFDENLPLYGWQEDIDYSSRASRVGVLLYSADCVGVHMGVSSGRTSGVKFGYSQIANPIYLYKKGTMTFKKMMTLMSRNIVSNILRTIILNRTKDYKGRLVGNSIAFLDLLLGKCSPMNILKF